MDRADIIEAVRAKLDEINPLDEGTTIMDPQIDAQLDAAAVDLVETLPSVLAYPIEAEYMPEPENLIQDLSVDIPCPSDFVRLHKLRLEHWTRSIYELLPPDDPKILLQDYVHMRATMRRPFGVLTRGDGVDIITCYPPPEGEDNLIYVEVSEFMYVPLPSAAEELNDGLIDMLAWNAAGIIYGIHGEPALAEAARGKLAEMIQKKIKYRS